MTEINRITKHSFMTGLFHIQEQFPGKQGWRTVRTVKEESLQNYLQQRFGVYTKFDLEHDLYIDAGIQNYKKNPLHIFENFNPDDDSFLLINDLDSVWS